MSNNAVVTKIIGSKKYASLLDSTVENVFISKPYNEENLRSKLHQIWGAYYTSRPDFNKLFKKIVDGTLDLNSITQIHSSTKEREQGANDLINEIFNIVGKNLSILDIGSALNPIFFLNRNDFKSYTCVDIDKEQQSFFSNIFSHLKKENMHAITGDALTDKFETADVVLAFKLLPVLDQVSPKQCDDFLKNLDCKYLVVTFPSKSLGGKNKGMVDNYRSLYVSRVEELGFKLVHENLFANESLYIFKAKSGN